MDDYKQLQMIENVKKIKEMEICYKSNLKLVKKQEQQINKLATCIEEIKEIAQYDVYTSRTDLCLKLNWIKKKISECEVDNE
jgi:hypothetical protein